jgi:hypothetical protein
VLDLMHSQPIKWFNAVKTWFGQGAMPKDLMERFAELKATRDVLEHAGGVANDQYVEKVQKAGGTPRYTPGHPIVIDPAYLHHAFDLMQSLMHIISQRSVAAADT